MWVYFQPFVEILFMIQRTDYCVFCRHTDKMIIVDKIDGRQHGMDILIVEKKKSIFKISES